MKAVLSVSLLKGSLAALFLFLFVPASARAGVYYSYVSPVYDSYSSSFYDVPSGQFVTTAIPPLGPNQRTVVSFALDDPLPASTTVDPRTLPGFHWFHYSNGLKVFKPYDAFTATEISIETDPDGNPWAFTASATYSAPPTFAWQQSSSISSNHASATNTFSRGTSFQTTVASTASAGVWMNVPVPEPSTIALAGVGVLALLAHHLRRRSPL